MKNIILLLISLFSYLTSFGQQYQRDNTYGIQYQRIKIDSALLLPFKDTSNASSVVVRPGMLIMNRIDSLLYVFNGSYWKPVSSGPETFYGNRPITLDVAGFLGVNPGSDTISTWLTNLFYPSQSPTASMTVTYNEITHQTDTVENMPSGADLDVVLNWTAGRQAATEPLSSIKIGNASQTFTQPSAPGTVSGTYDTVVVRNTNTTYTLTVTTTDSKSATATSRILWYSKRYWGFVDSINPDDATIQGLTQVYATSRTQTSKSISDPPSSEYICIAFPANLDASGVTQIWVNGLDQTGAFTKTTRSFTNASGYSQSYIIFVSNNPTASGINFELK